MRWRTRWYTRAGTCASVNIVRMEAQANSKKKESEDARRDTTSKRTKTCRHARNTKLTLRVLLLQRLEMYSNLRRLSRHQAANAKATPVQVTKPFAQPSALHIIRCIQQLDKHCRKPEVAPRLQGRIDRISTGALTSYRHFGDLHLAPTAPKKAHGTTTRCHNGSHDVMKANTCAEIRHQRKLPMLQSHEHHNRNCHDI